jgi:diketogulonate reductase-like aldo/keto reductase
MVATTSADNASIVLRTGAAMPRMGLGVFKSPSGEVTRQSVASAIGIGYRHIDTASIYGNEADVAAGIRDSGIARSELFLTTKLWNTDQGYDTALRAFDAALARMQLDYVDLFLLHWPVAEKRLDSWRALEELHRQRRARAIGVSNFMPRHMHELISAATVLPAVNQVEVSPFLQQREVRALCKEHAIVVAAYSPLTKGVRLAHPVVVQIANAIQQTPAQVLLRWGMQSDLVVLPKSSRAERLTENFGARGFSLSEDHMRLLDGLEEGLVTGWDPREQI